MMAIKHPRILRLFAPKCSQILDPEFPAMDELANEMAHQTGYEITHHQLNFFGLCPGCQKAGQSVEN